MILNLYTKDSQNKKFSLMKEDVIGDGSVGIVYCNDDRCFKHMLWHNRWQVNLITKVLELVKTMKNDNLCEIFDLYYENAIDETSLIGYEMQYYQSDDIDLLNIPMDYILDNFSDLMFLAQLLAKKGICIEDLHSDNVILQNNRIVVIDVDNYHLDNSSYEQLLPKNYCQLKLLLRSLLLGHLRTSKLNDNICWIEQESIKLLAFYNNIKFAEIMELLKKYDTPLSFIKQYK